MKINVHAVLAREEQRKKEAKPVPKIVIHKPGVDNFKPIIKKAIPPINDRELILTALETEFAKIKKERAKLSTKTTAIVNGIISKLQKEGNAVVQAFRKGEIPVPALKEHYAAIQELTDQLKVIYDKIEYVKTNGELPKEPEHGITVSNGDSPDIKAIHYEIRRLDDLICKTKDKITQATAGLKKPKNPERMATWHMKITMAEAERDEMKHKLKRMRYDKA
jgi:predicted  nucleic acid-binding Zn-ribbon protein